NNLDHRRGRRGDQKPIRRCDRNTRIPPTPRHPNRLRRSPTTPSLLHVSNSRPRPRLSEKSGQERYGRIVTVGIALMDIAEEQRMLEETVGKALEEARAKLDAALDHLSKDGSDSE